MEFQNHLMEVLKLTCSKYHPILHYQVTNMTVADLRTANEDLEIIVLCDGGYIHSTIHELKVKDGKLYCNIDINDDIDKSIQNAEELDDE